MSHEIRTPLNAIAGFANLLTNTPELEEEDKQNYVDIINTNTELLLRLINDILELSRLGSGFCKFQPTERRCADVTQFLLPDLRGTSEAGPQILAGFSKRRLYCLCRCLTAATGNHQFPDKC